MSRACVDDTRDIGLARASETLHSLGKLLTEGAAPFEQADPFLDQHAESYKQRASTINPFLEKTINPLWDQQAAWHEEETLIANPFLDKHVSSYNQMWPQQPSLSRTNSRSTSDSCQDSVILHRSRSDTSTSSRVEPHVLQSINPGVFLEHVNLRKLAANDDVPEASCSSQEFSLTGSWKPLIDEEAFTDPVAHDVQRREANPAALRASSCDSPGRRPLVRAHERKAPKRTKAELLRIWGRLDMDDMQMVTVDKLLQQIRFLEAECPELINRFEDVAKNGKVTKQDFIDFYLGCGSSPASPAFDESVDLVELREMFDTIVEGPGMEIRLADIIRHKRRVNSVCPALIEQFSKIDLDKSATISWEELKIFMTGTEGWLEYQFKNVIGLHTLKQQIRQFYSSILLDRRRQNAGHDIKIDGNYHMIFQGNPGTGKTSFARIVAQLLHRIGITHSDLLVEVQRDKLVAEYVGQTGPKTQKVIDEAKNGVLFVDEAYRLSQETGKNDFGQEAIEQLMAAMNDPPGKAPVMIFAGYEDDMEAFMTANSGLYRRIAYTFDFSDYSPQELARMLDGIVKAAGFRLDQQLTTNNFRTLAQVIETHTQPQARELMNGGICERIFAFAKQGLDAREALEMAGTLPSMELLEADIVGACGRIPPPPLRRESSAADKCGRSQLARAEERARTASLEVIKLQRQLTVLKSRASTGIADTEMGDVDDQMQSFLPPDEWEVRQCCAYSCGCLRFFACKFWHSVLSQVQRLLICMWYLLSRLQSLFSRKEPSTPVLPKSPNSSKTTVMGVSKSLDD